MFRGSIVALVTPLKNNAVDFNKLHDLVEFHIQEGTDAIVAAGTTGEAGTLTHKEKISVIKTVITAAKERIPVIAGTGAQSTQAAIELTQEAREIGAHGALIMTPAYIKPTQEGLFLHYKAIAEAASLPIILYNVPARTAVDILPETVARLAEIPNIIGIKEATGKMERFDAILQLAQGKIDIYSGDDLTAASWLLAGAKGVISVTANVVPRLMAKLCHAARENDKEAVLTVNESLMDLHRALFVESNPIPTKWALSQLNLINAEIRLPLTTLSMANQPEVKQALKKLGLIN
ncbi:MAG: 4-hydroxy-tetrahydrodipicolinate synthase [Legionellales bacterium RIFCSPHIGHO2_12_FULL_37_14]|nr:MAG: 4-hydroxy-tetrahydrodipicolinate synthase [Legionellales bacterium RIFCSPHIGHO2_12_FULL_37_14]